MIEDEQMINEGTIVNKMHNFLCLALFIQDGCTALMLACEEGHVSVAEYLIAQEADVNVKGNVCWDILNTRCSTFC
jgi:ankyrin repeat protein